VITKRQQILVGADGGHCSRVCLHFTLCPALILGSWNIARTPNLQKKWGGTTLSPHTLLYLGGQKLSLSSDILHGLLLPTKFRFKPTQKKWESPFPSPHTMLYLAGLCRYKYRQFLLTLCAAHLWRRRKFPLHMFEKCLSGGSSVRRLRREDPHRCQRKF
jgi:hypothetical protein